MNTKRFRTPKDIILLAIRWYLRFNLSTRDLEEILAERGIERDHSNIHRWVLRFTPVLEKVFRQRKKRIQGRLRMDETAVKVKGEIRYLYRAVDQGGQTVDFLLTAKRDRGAALRFLEKALQNQVEPTLINIDKSGANQAGINDYNDNHGSNIEIRQVKFMNNIVEADHGRIKRRIRSMRGFKSFWCARIILTGIELIQMIRKGQMKMRRGQCALSLAEKFNLLAA
jgi:putative transposase